MSKVSPEEIKNMTVAERESYLEQMKDDPTMKAVIEDLEHSRNALIQQASDPLSTYQRENTTPLTREMFLPYIATSPTAQKSMQAFENFHIGFFTLLTFGKQSIETDEDCDYLKPAFQAYSWAYMVLNIMYAQFYPPSNVFALLEQYIARRPNDIWAQYFKVCMIFNKQRPGVAKYEAIKEKIVAAELLAEKIRHLSAIRDERMVLISTYYLLGSMYSVTDQSERSLDSFQKCLDLDPTNIDAIYGLACQKKENDLDEAIKLYHRYLDIAPKCDKKYPNAFYQLGICYLSRYGNQQEALKYYRQGLKAEESRLPFTDKSHADIPPKRTLATLNTINDARR